ncbi:MAG: tetratricopeptide repeat protein [Bacteroidetes bacterium]|nr:tetratricopeptide repeat protein [Bacteroidota bacterium]
MKRILYIRITLICLCSVIVFLFNGCSVFESIGHAISQGYENSISYFNSYYNAQRLFNDAEEEYLKDISAKRSRDTTAKSAYQLPAGIKDKFVKVIDKCSNILAFHPASTLVDDALLLIGKSFYYQSEYLKAERKFSELIAQYPNSSLVPEAQIWYARTEEKLEKMNEAVLICESAIARAKEDDDEETEIQAHKILGNIYIMQNQTDKAILEYEKEIELSDDDDLKAEAQISLGNIYFSKEEYEKAAEAYLKVEDYTSEPYSNYYSKIQAVIAYRKIDDNRKGLLLLNEMIDNFRYHSYLADLLYERANSYALTGKLREAIEEYVYVDTSYANTEYSIRSAYQLGKIYEKEIGDYKLAWSYYNKSSSTSIQEISKDSRIKSAAFSIYFDAKKRINDADSLIFVLTDTTKKTVPDSLAEAQSKADSLAEFAGSLDDEDSEDQSVLSGRGRRMSARTALMAGDSLSSALDSTKNKMDIIKKVTIFDSLKTVRSLLDSAKYAVQQASSPESEIDSDSLALLVFIADSIEKEISGIVAKVTDSLNVIKSVAAQDLGDIFYTELIVPDSAMFWYEKSLWWSYRTSRSPRILYILAELARARTDGMYETPEVYYNRLNSDFPESVYANEARRLLGKAGYEKSIDTALVYYERAENQLYMKKDEEAVKTFRSIAQQYPASPFAAKSEYAIGWILENNLKKPIEAKEQYDLVKEKYTGTQYADAAAKRSRILANYESPKRDTTKTSHAGPNTDIAKMNSTGKEGARTDSTGKNKTMPVKADTSKKGIEITDTVNIGKPDSISNGGLKPDTTGLRTAKDTVVTIFGPVSKKVPDTLQVKKDSVVSGKKLLN